MKYIYILFACILGVYVYDGIKLDRMAILQQYHIFEIFLSVLMIMVLCMNRTMYRKANTNVIEYILIYQVAFILVSFAFIDTKKVYSSYCALTFPFVVYYFSYLLGYVYKPNARNLEMLLYLVIVALILSIPGFIKSRLAPYWLDQHYYSYLCSSFICGSTVAFVYFARYKWQNIVFSILPIVMLLFTAKRGPLLSMAGAFLFIYVFQRKSIINVLKLFGIAACLYLVFDLYMHDEIQILLERLTNEEMDIKSDDAGNGRVQLWDIYMNSWINGNPLQQLFGFGRNPEIIKQVVLKMGRPFSPHNAYVGLLYWNGILGIIFYIYFLYRNYKVGIEMQKQRYIGNMTFLLMILFLIFSSFVTVHYEGNYPVLIVMFILGLLYGNYQAQLDYNRLTLTK